jgi:hypothetical protein
LIDLVNANGFLPIQTALLSPPATVILPASDPNDDIARFPIRILIGFTLEDNFVALGHSWRYFQSEAGRMIHDLLTATMGADLADGFAVSMTLITGCLALCEHPWEYLLFNEFNASSAAS